MAKGKGKKVSSGGPHKKHGPKKKMFHCWDSTTRLAFAKAGLLKKNCNYESFVLACNSRGERNTSEAEFRDFAALPKEKQTEYFKNLSK